MCFVWAHSDWLIKLVNITGKLVFPVLKFWSGLGYTTVVPVIN